MPRPRPCTNLALIVMLCLVVEAASASPPPSPAPMSVTFHANRMGKPPLRFYDVTLSLRNDSSEVRWFVIRSSQSRPLPKHTGRFSTVGSFKIPFGGKSFAGPRGTRAIQVTCFGAAHGFLAFRVAPKSRLTLAHYTLDSGADVSDVEVWTARAIRVNGKTLLERWLPYGTLSSKGARADGRARWTNLDWDPAKNLRRTDYPKEAVTHVEVEITGRWTVPMKPRPGPTP